MSLGKKGYMHTVIERKGLPTGTVLNSTIKEAEIAKHTLELRHTPKLSISVGSCELPHPYKRTEGVASSRRSMAMSCCGCQMYPSANRGFPLLDFPHIPLAFP